jgi:hypothetical protein
MARMHIGNNVYVERHGDEGAMRIVRAEGFDSEPDEVLATFDQWTWASMIAFASVGGETGENYKKALVFHTHSERPLTAG